MNAVSLSFDAALVVMFAIIYTLLDKKYPQIRIKYIYREKLWQNFLVNLIFVAFFYTLWSLIFGYTAWV